MAKAAGAEEPARRKAAMTGLRNLIHIYIRANYVIRIESSARAATGEERALRKVAMIETCKFKCIHIDLYHC